MASLQSSCAVLATAPHHRNPASSKPLSAKPPHFLTHARRSHRFQVSCNGGGPDGKPSAQGKVDRRNMLLGLGGLYGAANLISDPKASADPIEAPEFNKCGPAYPVPGSDPVDPSCCPPVSDKVIDYQLPPVTKKRVRPAVHLLTKDYLEKYEEALRRMKALDSKDPLSFTQQANVHCAYCNGAHDQVGHPDLDIQVHFSWLFFPFHRWYLYFYERILGKLINDPTFALPFWCWDNPSGMSMPQVYDRNGSPLFDQNRNQANRYPKFVDLSMSTDNPSEAVKRARNLSTMYNEMIGRVSSVEGFMGAPYKAGDQPPGFASAGSSESGSHTGVHVWVGSPVDSTHPYNEDMGNFYSAGRDPLFYSHHANVDRMWSIWKTLDNGIEPKDITDKDYLNASFLFYDENRQLVRVRVGQCLDHRPMGYDYQQVDIPWVNYRPPQKAARAKIQDLASGAKTADKLFPLTLKDTVRVLVPKSAKGKVDEVLVLEGVETDSSKFVKFDVYVNDEDDKPTEVDKAEFAGSFAQVPHRNKAKKMNKGFINMSLKELYENIDIADDDTVVVTIVPRANGGSVTIGGIKIIPAPPKSS